ncbi:MAG: glutamate racemase [Candidatus Omnitrophota bacterium]
MKNKAIGIFDSGIGGLTVYRAIKEKLPHEKVIYLGDTARLPYGTKSAETIIKFSDENAHFLLERAVKIIVVACNSASSYALPSLQDKLDIPVLGVIEPGADAAVKSGKTCIGVIGTSATISSNAYEHAILERCPDARVISKDCPLFVPLVEEGWIDHPVTRLVIEEYLLPLKAQRIDSLVLGCTHYPVLKVPISRVMGEEIRLIDSAETIAQETHAILKSLGWLNHGEPSGSDEDEFFVTDFPERFKKVGEIFLGRHIDAVNTATF